MIAPVFLLLSLNTEEITKKRRSHLPNTSQLNRLSRGFTKDQGFVCNMHREKGQNLGSAFLMKFDLQREL